ncbi:hypothetical protein APE_1588 [Aeropyrum pernix K1]|uniref:PIN domain-containing protein n=1 Tax=Aeropyrum pernix (strain ATCC 700893 / DSM 11879 / JCM 9820 / NBRC 100138 / K1) TaxID=272557 RepID=Q9YBL0_AERPE|nr:PIN domain-containing protein [Aeropyrum pernix]BAA80588.1 hypothetical protein APE_1588 [Aeropyrum pernix K1]
MPAGLDTNILIYAMDNKAGEKHEKAVEVIEQALKHPTEYIVSSQVLAETIYAVKRKYPAATPLAQTLAYTLTRTLRVVHYTHLEVLQASQSPPRYFWDRLLAYTYLNNGADRIITEDEKPYRGILKTIDPFR